MAMATVVQSCIMYAASEASELGQFSWRVDQVGGGNFIRNLSGLEDRTSTCKSLCQRRWEVQIMHIKLGKFFLVIFLGEVGWARYYKFIRYFTWGWGATFCGHWSVLWCVENVQPNFCLKFQAWITCHIPKTTKTFCVCGENSLRLATLHQPSIPPSI